MNIFVLDKDPKIAPLYLTDTHLHKMFVEGLQLVFTTLQQFNEPKDYFYKPIKQGPELVNWLGYPNHMLWMAEYLETIEEELKRTRPEKVKKYKCIQTFEKLINDELIEKFIYYRKYSGFRYVFNRPKYFIFRCTEDYPHQQCNRELVHVDVCVKLYREFYKWKYNNFKKDKDRKYTGREVPEFLL